jgi:hypothetical protein
LGIFTRQIGRQYIPVEETPTKKRPSKRASFALNAAYRPLLPFAGIFFISLSLFGLMYIIYFEKLAAFGHVDLFFGYVFRQTPIIVIPGLAGNMLADHYCLPFVDAHDFLYYFLYR